MSISGRSESERLLHTFVVPDPVREDWFGQALAADETGMVAGAPGQVSNLFVPAPDRAVSAAPGRAFMATYGD